jgi:hypothetical protein
VLLIDHHHAELREGHPVLDQRVRAHHDPRGTGGRVEQRLLAGPRGQRAGEQRDAGGLLRGAQLARPTEVAEQRAQRAGVLHGEHLGGRQQRRLPAGVDGLQHRPQRHHGLAGADLPLQQPVHRVLARQLGAELLPHGALTGGEGEGQSSVECVGQPTRPVRAPRCRTLQGVVPAPGQGQLHGQCLVPLQPSARGAGLGVVRRAVHPAQRLGQTRQPVRTPQDRG